MNIVTNMRHYVSTSPNIGEVTKKEIGDDFYYNGHKCKIIKKETPYILIKGVIGQFCLNMTHRETLFFKN